MLEESEGQGSRLRGERQGGRQRKRGSQVRVSDGDRPQRTQRHLPKYLGVEPPERIYLEKCSTVEVNLRGPLHSLRLFFIIIFF